MFKLLIDTCVWLDLAKDPRQQSLLDVLEELVERKEVSLIVPRTVRDEFQRNKERILQESKRSLSSHFKQVKEAITKFGDPQSSPSVLEQLNDLDHKIPLLGESAASGSLRRIEKLLQNTIIDLTDQVKLRAAQRAIDGRAPFHRNKNSIGDALIIETYAACVKESGPGGARFAFVTHNITDFSVTEGNRKLPHPDIATLFTKRKSLYFINLSEALHKINPTLLTENMLEQVWIEEPRGLTEILEAELELTDKIWYNRHHNWLYKIETGQHRIVDESIPDQYDPNTTPRYIYEGALKSAKRVEKLYGLENLGPWDDFEWGMLNGKLSALRWVLGEDWDELYT